MNSVIIYGTGEAARNHLRFYQSELEILGFVDRGAQQSEFHGYPIFSLSELPDLSFSCVFVASQYFDEIIPNLLALGIPSDKIMVSPLVFPV